MLLDRCSSAFRAIMVLVFAVCVGYTSHAQSQMTLPLVENIYQSSWENPALRPDHRYSLGVLSSFEIGMINNGFQLSQVTTLDADGKFVLQPNQLERRLSDHGNMVYADLEIEMLHFRFNIYDWFIWFGARNITRNSFTYDKVLISLFINGNKQSALAQEPIQLRTLGLDLMNYTELTLGFSKIEDNWTIGMRASYLSGVANMHLVNDKLSLRTSIDPDHLYALTVETDGALMTSGLPVDPNNNQTDFERVIDPEYLKNKQWFGINNPGFAVSLGGTYNPIKELTLSLSVSDIGMIHWGDDVGGYALEGKSGKRFFEGLSGLVSKALEKDGKVDFDSYRSDLERQYKPTLSDAKVEPYNTWLSPKVHFGLSYDIIPKTRVGFNFSGIYHNRSFYPSATVYFQQRVNKWFLGQVSYSYNQRSFTNLGLGLVFTARPFQFYLVTDNLLGAIKPSIMRATNVRFGLNFVWGTLYENAKLPHRNSHL